MWADLGQSLLVGVKGSKWSQISHRKLNISIWVSSILVKSPKDHLLRRGLDYSALLTIDSSAKPKYAMHLKLTKYVLTVLILIL